MPLAPAFEAFMATAEPRLRRALIARHGIEAGGDATLDAFVYCWQHWGRVSVMDNPLGYLYRVGTSRVRYPKSPRRTPLEAVDHDPWIEPALEPSLDLLTENQRVAVVLHHSFEWTYEEIAEFLEVSVSTVRNHLSRGMDKLRTALEVTVHG
jgi:DNA-directed RNA polymerase specialized sigma24 family protein